MVGACGAAWLAALAMGVVAGVALARLASGHAGGAERHSSALLYSIIAVSVLVIAGAIPLLLRAHRGAGADSATAEAGSDVVDEGRGPVRPPAAATEKMRVFGVDPYAERRLETPRAVPDVPAPVLDRLWLRGTVALLGAMGVALTAVAAGSYLLASASDNGAWIAFGVAGVVTIAMPAVLAFFQRQVGDAVDEATA
jgi:hypothetical protein